jgi:hypothetical protein
MSWLGCIDGAGDSPNGQTMERSGADGNVAGGKGALGAVLEALSGMRTLMTRMSDAVGARLDQQDAEIVALRGEIADMREQHTRELKEVADLFRAEFSKQADEMNRSNTRLQQALVLGAGAEAVVSTTVASAVSLPIPPRRAVPTAQPSVVVACVEHDTVAPMMPAGGFPGRMPESEGVGGKERSSRVRRSNN